MYSYQKKILTKPYMEKIEDIFDDTDIDKM